MQYVLIIIAEDELALPMISKTFSEEHGVGPSVDGHQRYRDGGIDRVGLGPRGGNER